MAAQLALIVQGTDSLKSEIVCSSSTLVSSVQIHFIHCTYGVQLVVSIFAEGTQDRPLVCLAMLDARKPPIVPNKV